MAIWIGVGCRPVAAVFAAVLLVPRAYGTDYPIGEGKLGVSASAYVGTAFRTDDQDPELLPNVNSSLISIEGSR